MLIYYGSDDVVTFTLNGAPSWAPPGNFIEVPDDTAVAVGADEVIGGALVPVVPDPAVALAAARAVAFMSKMRFLNDVAARGILTDADAIGAAKGEWPSAMASFLDLLTASQKRDVQIAWSASTQVDRMDPFLLIFASWLLPAAETETTMDAIFGIGA